jgi:hypothetical protein
VEHLPQEFGAPLVEGVAGPSGARGLGREGIQAPLVEVVDGVAHGLLPAAEAPGDPRGILSPGARQQDLASAQGESVFRAQPGLEVFTLLFGERTYKDWSFHGAYCNSQHETYLEDALGPILEQIGSLTQRIRDYDRKLEEISKERYPESELLRQVEGT